MIQIKLGIIIPVSWLGTSTLIKGGGIKLSPNDTNKVGHYNTGMH
jgi:hypothetical protein